jgi:hypothetical protein
MTSDATAKGSAWMWSVYRVAGSLSERAEETMEAFEVDTEHSELTLVLF